MRVEPSDLGRAPRRSCVPLFYQQLQGDEGVETSGDAPPTALDELGEGRDARSTALNGAL